MANYLALQLDRQGEAEMSCIAGVGGNVKNLVRLAKCIFWRNVNTHSGRT